MKIRTLIFLGLGLFGMLGLVLYVIWPRNHVEIQLLNTKQSPDGQWIAILQLEIYNAASASDYPVYAVRLKKAGQKNVQGDVVMVVPVNYPEPEPSIGWRDSTLLIALSQKQNYQYLANSVHGVDVALQRNNQIESTPDSKP